MAILENITVFLRSVETGSFSSCGRAMRLTPAVVSHRISMLEKHLGCRLFNRTTRAMQLTEQGRIFYERCIEIREAVERAETAVAELGATPRGTLKITAPLGFGRRVIAPLAGKFRATHPEIDIRLRLSDHLLDLLSESVDLAVRLAPLADSGLILRKISDVKRVLVASPNYLSRKGEPTTLNELVAHSCLLLRFPGSTQYRLPMIVDNKVQQLTVTGHIDADDGDILTDWAIAGEGIALKPLFEVAEHIHAGRLVALTLPVQPATLAVLYPYQRMVPAKVRLFSDMILDEARPYIANQLRLING